MNDVMIDITKRQIQVMQAFVDGEKIQMMRLGHINGTSEWTDTPNPQWDWLFTDYRVKPKKNKF